MRIRPAEPGDATALAAIYAFHVAHGTATFDTDAPPPEVFAERVLALRAAGAPFLVAERDGAILGYAYAARFRDRPAYRFTCENSIYVADGERGRGVGRALLEALLAAAREAGFRQMIAVVGGGEPASVALHAACGFIEAGRMRSVGRKFGRWLDTVYMQRALGAGDSGPVLCSEGG
jgi:phosphinothricin acetyltransferase